MENLDYKTLYELTLAENRRLVVENSTLQQTILDLRERLRHIES